MTIRKKPLSDVEKARVLEGLRREQAARMKGYRERALAMYPHVCARCGRALEGKRLRELTVHHKDHNHDNNPPDGSNWELLCLYCHDHEHEGGSLGQYYDGGVSEDAGPGPSIFKPFEGLDLLVKPDEADGRK